MGFLIAVTRRRPRAAVMDPIPYRKDEAPEGAILVDPL